MAMRWRDLPRQDQLQAGEQRMGDPILSHQTRILEDQNAAFSFLGGNQAARLRHERADDVVVTPMNRLRWTDWRAGRGGDAPRAQRDCGDRSAGKMPSGALEQSHSSRCSPIVILAVAGPEEKARHARTVRFEAGTG